jgi:hypothetical protein
MDGDPHGSRPATDRTAIPVAEWNGVGLGKTMYFDNLLEGELAVLDELEEYDREDIRKSFQTYDREYLQKVYGDYRPKTHARFGIAQKIAAQSLISASNSYLGCLSRQELIQAKELLQKIADELWDYQDRLTARHVFNQCERVIEKLTTGGGVRPSTEKTLQFARYRINKAVDASIGAQPISDRDRDHCERCLLDYFIEHGYIPPFSIAKVSD